MAILVLSLSTFHFQLSTAQHYVGLKAGYGGASGRMYTSWGPGEGQTKWNKYTGGLMWRYYSHQQVVGGVAAELEYQMRGYSIFGGSTAGASFVVSDSTSYYVRTRTVSSITVPLIWQPHVYMMNQRVRLFASAGFTVSYNTGMGDTFTESYYGFDAQGERTVTHEETKWEWDTARDVRWNYGAVFGGGVGVSMGRWEVAAEARYYWGMSDILRNKTKYQFNADEPIRSELNNLFITMGVYFRLGKGGISEPPLGKRRKRAAGEDNFTNIK